MTSKPYKTKNSVKKGTINKKTSKRRSTNVKVPLQTTSAHTLFLKYLAMSHTVNKIQLLDNQVDKLRNQSREIMKKREKTMQIYPRIQHLRYLVTRQQALLEEEKKVIKKRKENLLRASKIIKDNIAYNKLSNKKVIDAIESYHADRHSLQSFDRKLKLRQHKMCRQLLHIFPFRRVRNASTSNNNLYVTNYEIRTMPLPSRIDKLLNIANNGGQDEEKMAIGLGYIAHLSTLLSRYLQIPLRHSIICKGSRSEIIDTFEEANSFMSTHRIKNQKKKSSKYPLYSKNTDKKLFKKGVELLQEDICQLCISVGMSEFDQYAFIHNVRTVLYSKALARF